MRMPLWSLMILLALVSPLPAQPHEAVLKAEAQRIEAIRKASAATLAIFANNGAGGGSGVVISPDGYALTNFHVAKPAGEAMKCGMNDGRLYDAVIVSVDPTGDVALIKLLARNDFPHAELGDSDQVRVGDWCFAAGNPFLLANDFTPSISYGVVSGVHRYQYPAGTLLEYTDCLQTDAAINPGNSGGPLFGAQGQLIGINGRGSFEKRGRVNVGVGYAISINQIKNFLGYLRSGRIVDHASFGATVATDSEGRVVVDQILDSSDAYRRGLRYDDEIVAFAGRPVDTVNAFKNVLGIYPRGWRLPLSYRREGVTYQCQVRLAGLHHRAELEEVVHSPEPSEPMPRPKKPGPRPKEPGPKEPAPEQPRPRPSSPHTTPHGKKPPMPKIVADHFEARRGYANYFFNRLEQDRVWKGVVARGDFSTAPADWTIAGQLQGGGDVLVSLTDEVGSIRLPAGESKASFAGSLAESLSPPGTGGLLAALHVWQRLLLVGPQKLGEVYYLGTMPLASQDELVDVLVAIFGGVETRFYVNPKDGYLVGVEMFPDEETDPAEVYFSDYREVEGRSLPHRWEIHHAGALFAVVEVSQYRLEPAASTSPP